MLKNVFKPNPNPKPDPDPNPYNTLNHKPNDTLRSYSLSPEISSQEQLSLKQMSDHWSETGLVYM